MRNSDMMSPFFLGMAIGVVGAFCYLKHEGKIKDGSCHIHDKVNAAMDKINDCC